MHQRQRLSRQGKGVYSMAVCSRIQVRFSAHNPQRRALRGPRLCQVLVTVAIVLLVARPHEIGTTRRLWQGRGCRARRLIVGNQVAFSRCCQIRDPVSSAMCCQSGLLASHLESLARKEDISKPLKGFEMSSFR